MSGEAEAAFTDAAKYADEADAMRNADSGSAFVDSAAPATSTENSVVAPVGAELVALARLRTSAKRLKAAELEFRAAQQAYAEAVKALSDEVVK